MALLYHHFENGCFMADSQTVLDIRDAVSYTHLDVYKRQVKYTANEGLFMHIWINLLDNAIKFSPSKGTMTTVSDTHLDVYKRQPFGVCHNNS